MRLVLLLTLFFNIAQAQPLLRLGDGVVSHALFPVADLREHAYRHILVLRTREDRFDRSKTTDTCYQAEFDTLFRLIRESNFETIPFESRNIQYRNDNMLAVVEDCQMQYRHQSSSEERYLRYYNKWGQADSVIHESYLNSTFCKQETRIVFDSLGRKRFIFENQNLAEAFEYLPSGDMARRTEYFYENRKGNAALDSILTVSSYTAGHRLASETRQPSPTFLQNIGVECGRESNNHVVRTEYDSLGRLTRVCRRSPWKEPMLDPESCWTRTYWQDTLADFLVLNGRQSTNLHNLNPVWDQDIQVRYAPEAEIGEESVFHYKDNAVDFQQTLYLEESRLPIWITKISGPAMETFEFQYFP